MLNLPIFWQKCLQQSGLDQTVSSQCCLFLLYFPLSSMYQYIDYPVVSYVMTQMNITTIYKFVWRWFTSFPVVSLVTANIFEGISCAGLVVIHPGAGRTHRGCIRLVKGTRHWSMLPRSSSRSVALTGSRAKPDRDRSNCVRKSQIPSQNLGQSL